MPLLDISEITNSVVTLITEAFTVCPIWTIAPPNVYPEPPEKLTQEGLGFYLYHIQESPDHKNLPSRTPDLPPVRFAPMGLLFYYQLTANSTIDDGTGAYNEQLMMGIAMKALHDYPHVNDTTVINGVTIMRPSLLGKNNHFRISMQPIAYQDAVHYWTAGTYPIKLAAYYEVSVVFLEPEQSQLSSGRVLSYGNYIFTEGPPRITGTQNIISFTIPGTTGIQMIKLQPAQVSPGDLLTIFGSAFDGDRQTILLISPNWTGPAIAGPAWGQTFTAPNTLSITVQKSATLQSTLAPVDVIPGMYTMQVAVDRSMPMPDGTLKVFTSQSNYFAFTVTPQLTAVSPIVAGVVTVTGYIFQHPYLVVGDIQVYIGAARLDQITVGPVAASQFLVAAANTMQIGVPAGLTVGNPVPLRILIKGAESPPNWITP